MRTRFRVALVAAVYVACFPLWAQAQTRNEQEILDLM